MPETELEVDNQAAAQSEKSSDGTLSPPATSPVSLLSGISGASPLPASQLEDRLNIYHILVCVG